MSIKLYPGDNRESLRRLIDQGVRVHSVVCDPPYGLTSITKRFSKSPRSEATENTETPFGRTGRGFMGRTWDGTNIERDPEFWKLVYEILLPGGYVFAFSGARTGHWQAVAMEMAGFIHHPMHGYCFGSGFPKAHNASKAIDKLLGTTEQREVLDIKYEAKRFAPGATVVKEGGYRKRTEEDGNEQTFHATTERGGSAESRRWDGWAYGAQAQKPALEPIYLCQKPYSEKTGAANLLKHGVGAVNIDGCRVASEESTLRTRTAGDFGLLNDDGWEPKNGSETGRHPSNLILSPGVPEYELRRDISVGDKKEVLRWLYENA